MLLFRFISVFSSFFLWVWLDKISVSCQHRVPSARFSTVTWKRRHITAVSLFFLWLLLVLGFWALCGEAAADIEELLEPNISPRWLGSSGQRLFHKHTFWLKRINLLERWARFFWDAFLPSSGWLWGSFRRADFSVTCLFFYLWEAAGACFIFQRE